MIKSIKNFIYARAELKKFKSSPKDQKKIVFYSEGKDLRGTELDRQVKARGKGGSSSGLSDEDLLKKYGG